MRFYSLGLALCAAVLLVAQPDRYVSAQAPSPSGAILSHSSPLAGLKGFDVTSARKRQPSKLQGVLVDLVDAAKTGGRSATEQLAAQRALELYGDKVLVVAETGPRDPALVARAIEALGGQVGTIAGDRVSALMPITELPALAKLETVALIRTPLPMTQLAITSEGVNTIGATPWQGSGLTGQGVTVAVVDFGFANWSALQSSGDLPLGSRLVRKNYKATPFEEDGQHGSAVAEIVYDIAPGVSKLILYAFDDDADLEAIVTDMLAEGVEVVAMSIGWYAGGPFDGTGFIDDQVNRARNVGGIFWANSAGNEAQAHYEGYFVPSTADPTRHAFASSTNINQIGYLSAGSEICMFLTWNEWPQATSDYDLLIMYTTGSSWAPYDAWESNNSGQPPYEGGCITVNASATYGIAIVKYAGSTRYLELYSPTNALQYKVGASSLLIPADADGAVAVGAFNFGTPGTIEDFSSRGPRNASGGGPWSGSCPHPNCKPQLAAPDGVSTVAYGTRDFFGTSAAAPHAAGAAALVKQAYPAYTAAQILSFLQGRAIDQGTSGYDNVWGAGRLSMGPLPPATPTPTRTLTATATASPTPTVTPTHTATPTPTPTLTPTVTPEPTATATATASPTVTPTAISTAIATATPTETVTLEPTATATATPTVTPTVTPTAISTAIATPTPTATDTAEPTPTMTATATDAHTVTPTPTATDASEPTATPTATPEAPLTATATATEAAEPAPTPTETETATPEPVATATPTETATSEPTATATATLEPTATPTATVTPTTSWWRKLLHLPLVMVNFSPLPLPTSEPTFTATPTAGCPQLLANPGFELDQAWKMAISAYPAGYATTVVHSGTRSLRTGIDGGGDKASYSGSYQDVALPAGATDAALSFWWYPISAEVPMAAAAAAQPDLALVQAAVDGSLPAGALAGDVQYAVLADQSGNVLQTLLWTRSNAQTWQWASYPIAKSLAGRTVRVLFGAYNDGNGRSSTMYIDDVALTLCSQTAATATPTATATATRTVTPSRTSTPTATPTVTVTVTPSRTPTPTASFTPTPTHTATLTPTRTSTPSPTATQIPTASATATSTPTATLTPTATVSPAASVTPHGCTERVSNGGFEANAAWTFTVTGSTAGYSTTQPHTGARAARFGLLPGATSAADLSGFRKPDRSIPERNRLGELAPLGGSYSSSYQIISVPSTADKATLTLWYYPGSAATTGDYQRVVLLQPGTFAGIKTLMKVQENDRAWKQTSFDLTAYRGMSLVLYIEVFNDSTAAAGRTWMYLDDVSVLACPK